MPFVDFMDIALFEPDCGYYTASRERIGRAAHRDFYTASSLGPLFGELVVSSAIKLLGEAEPSHFSLVEIGAEPGVNPFAHVAMPFAEHLRLGVGQPLELPRRAVVFANELFDAQPCVRLRFAEGRWRELGVCLEQRQCREILTEPESRDAQRLLPLLPKQVPEGYQFDYAPRAESLLQHLLEQPWEGVCLAFDYGKTMPELLEATPQGTARAYFRHRQERNLVARPGCQDLTSDVAWDRLEAVMRAHRFKDAGVFRQESFFVHHAADAVRTTMEEGDFEQKRLLTALLHPQHFGGRFQVLVGQRLEAR